MDLSIIIVNYNTRELIDECLASLFQHLQDKGSEIFVVDNASRDGSVELIREKYPTVHLIENEENVYFIRANNQALRKTHTGYVALLNSDTVLIEDSFRKMIGFMDAHPEIGACSPRLINPDGTLQRTCMRFPSIVYGIFELVFINKMFPGNHINNRTHYADWLRDDTREVEVAAGACLLLRRDILDRVGLLDEEYVMYNEEVDWCRRIRDSGFKVYFYSDTSIIHHVGGSTRKSAHMRRIYVNSFLLVYKKYYGYFAYIFLNILSYLSGLAVFIARDIIRLRSK